MKEADEKHQELIQKVLENSQKNLEIREKVKNYVKAEEQKELKNLMSKNTNQNEGKIINGK